MPSSVSVKGIVCSGTGRAARYFRLAPYLKFFTKHLGREPFHGTLNIMLTVNELSKLSSLQPISLRSFSFEGRHFGGVRCWRGTVAGIGVLLVRPEKTTHASEILEVVAPVNLRERLGLKNGDVLEVILD
jgi:riboflavin kinase